MFNTIQSKFNFLILFILLLFIAIGFASTFYVFVVISLLTFGFIIIAMFLMKMRRTIIVPLNLMLDALEKTKDGDVANFTSNLTVENEDEMKRLIENFNLLLNNHRKLLVDFNDFKSAKNKSINLIAAQLVKMDECLSGLSISEVSPFIRDYLISLEELFGQVQDLVTSTDEIITLSYQEEDDIDFIADAFKNLEDKVKGILGELEGMELERFSDFVTDILNTSKKADILSINAFVESEQIGKDGAGIGAISKEIKNFAVKIKEISTSFGNVLTEVNSLINDGSSTVNVFFEQVSEVKSAIILKNDLLKSKSEKLRILQPRFQMVLNNLNLQLRAVRKVDSFLLNLEEAVGSLHKHIGVCQKETSVLNGTER